MWTVSEAPDVLTALGSLIGGTAALVAAVVAYRGVNTWRAERSSDLARRLASVVYEHRLSLHAIRIPSVSVEEREYFEITAQNPYPSAVTLLQRWQKSRVILDRVNAVLAEGDLRWNGSATPAYKEVLEVDKAILLKIFKLRHIENKILGTKPSDEERITELGVDSFKGQSELSDYLDGDDLRVQIEGAFDEITCLLKKNI